MGKKNKGTNVRNVNKWRGYYMEDMECVYCASFQNEEKRCKHNKCRYEDEKLDAIANGRIKRRRGSMKWDG